MNDTKAGELQFDLAATKVLSELTLRWQCFASQGMTSVEQWAIRMLITCGIAKTQLGWKVSDLQSGDWLLLRYVVTGNFVGDPMMKVFSKQCPEGWIDPVTLKERQGVVISAEPNTWMLALTDYGSELRNRNLTGRQVVEAGRLQPVIAKDGIVEIGKTQGPSIEWSNYHPPGDWHKPFGMNPTQWRKSLRETWIPQQLAERDPLTQQRGDVRFRMSLLKERGIIEPK